MSDIERGVTSEVIRSVGRGVVGSIGSGVVNDICYKVESVKYGEVVLEVGVKVVSRSVGKYVKGGVDVIIGDSVG